MHPPPPGLVLPVGLIPRIGRRRHRQFLVLDDGGHTPQHSLLGLGPHQCCAALQQLQKLLPRPIHSTITCVAAVQQDFVGFGFQGHKLGIRPAGDVLSLRPWLATSSGLTECLRLVPSRFLRKSAMPTTRMSLARSRFSLYTSSTPHPAHQISRPVRRVSGQALLTHHAPIAHRFRQTKLVIRRSQRVNRQHILNQPTPV